MRKSTASRKRTWAMSWADPRKVKEKAAALKVKINQRSSLFLNQIQDVF
jgi:hypothetical protein